MPPGVCLSYIKVNSIAVPFELHIIPNKVYDEDEKKEVLTRDWITRKEWKVIRTMLDSVVQNAARLHKDISKGHLYSPPADAEIMKADNLVLGVFFHLNTRNRSIPCIESSLKDPTSPYWWDDSEMEQAETDDGEDEPSRRIQICKVVVKVCVLGGTNGEDPVETNESLSKALDACKKNYNNDFANADYDQGPYDNEIEEFQLGHIDEPIIPGVHEIIKNVNTTSTDPKIIEEQWNSMSNYFEERDDDTDSFPGIRSSESDDDDVDEDEELPDIDYVAPAPIRPQPVYELPLQYKNKITTESEKSKKSDPVTPTRASRSSGRGRRRGESCMELVTASGKTIDILNEIRNETRSKTRAGSISVALKPTHPKSSKEQNTLRHIESSRKSSSSPTKKKKKKKRRSSSRSPHPTKNTPTASHLPFSTKEVRRSPDVTSTTSSQSPSKSRRRSNSESTIRPERTAAKRNLNVSADSDDEVVITKEKARPRRKERQLLAANKIKIEKDTSTSPQRRPSLTASPDRRTKEKEPLPERDPEMPTLQVQAFHYTSDSIISRAPSLRPEQSPVSNQGRVSRGRKSALSGIEKSTSRRKSNLESQDTGASTEIRKHNRVTFSEAVEKVKSKKRKSTAALSLERVPSPSTPKASANTVNTARDHSSGNSSATVTKTPSQNLSNTTLTDTSLTRSKEKEIDDHGGSTKKSERLKKRKKRDKRDKEIHSKSTDAVTIADPSKVSESIPSRESSNDALSSTKRKRKKKRLEREVSDSVKPRSERVAKRLRMEKPIENESERAKDTTPSVKPATPIISVTPAAVSTRVADEVANRSRPSSATTSSFITSPGDIPSYAGKSLIEVMNELSNSSLDDRSKSPSVPAAPERSKSPDKKVVEEPRKPERTKSLTVPISTFGSSKSAFVSTSSMLTATTTTQMSTELEASNPVIIVVPAPLKVSQTTQTEDTDMDIEMYLSSRLLPPRTSSNWNMKVIDENECESTAIGLKALALVSLAYGDDDMDSGVQEDHQDSDYDKPNRIMAELHESAERSSSPPPIITVDDSDPEDVYSLFDLTEGPPIKREAELGIKKEVEIPAKYDLFEDTTCVEDPFMRLLKIEIDSQPEFSANNGSDLDELQCSPEDFSTAIPYSPPSNFYEPEEDDFESKTVEHENERASPEPCCSKSLKNNDSMEMPPPLMPPPKSPRKSAKHKKEKDRPTALVPAIPKNLEKAALAAAGVNQQLPDLETFEIMRNPDVLRHTLNKIHKAQTESLSEDDIRRVISGDYSDVTEVCSVRYASKKPEKRKHNSQGIKLEDEDSDDSQSHQLEMDSLAAMGSELLTKEVQRRSKDARKASRDAYIPQGDQFDLSQQSMCFLDSLGTDYAKSSRSHKQWRQLINELPEHEHRKIFKDISLKLHSIVNEVYSSERFDMWKHNDPELTENYIVARDLLFADNTADFYSDFIISEFDSIMDALTEKHHNCSASDPEGKAHRWKLETLVLMPETLTLVLAKIANITLEQAALVMIRGKFAPPVETSSSETRKAQPSSLD